MTSSKLENININLQNLIYTLWKKLKKQRKMQIILLFCFVLASAFSEVFSLGSVLCLQLSDSAIIIGVFIAIPMMIFYSISLKSKYFIGEKI